MEPARSETAPPEQRTLRIHLFGPLSVEGGRRPLGPRSFGGVKPKQLLEILLAARGRPVLKDRLIDLLWGEDLPSDPVAVLETHVSRLRAQLDPDRRHQFVRTERGAYRFAVECADVDLERFDRLLHLAGRSNGAPARARLEEALALVRGEVLEDEPDAAWAIGIRDRYRGLVLRARLDLAGASLNEGLHEKALTLAQQALETDPLHEHACRVAMLASYALGRQHDALQTYLRCRDRLAEELGVDPVEETEGLYVAILSGIGSGGPAAGGREAGPGGDGSRTAPAPFPDGPDVAGLPVLRPGAAAVRMVPVGGRVPGGGSRRRSA